MAKCSFLTALIIGCFGVFPASAANISFADAQVKAACVAHWDTNGDGELSTGEAAAVSTLGDVFRANKAITTFAELRFFTGLTAIGDHAFYQSTLEEVTLPASVTAISDYAFAQSNLSGELRVPGTVRTIGDYAFNSCKRLTSVVLEEGVESVGWHAFSGPIGTLSLPASLTYMSSMAIDPYVNADPSSGIFIPEGDLYVYVHTATPALINQYAFYYVFADGHLVVPSGTVEAYKAATAWSHFAEYLEMGDVNMDGQLNIMDVVALRAYLLGNDPQPFNRHMADMNGDGQLNIMDVVGLRRILLER